MWFPKWAYDPKYLPSIENLPEIQPDSQTWNFGFSDFIAHNPLWTPFQLLNQEFIEWISNELLKVIKEISNENIKILEVWAWNWRLSYFLKKDLIIEKTKKSVEIIATDDFSWFTDEFEENCQSDMFFEKCKWIDVENLNVEKSIKKYNPNIIISSWMPHKEDWTELFRKNENVDAFLIIWNVDECWTDNTWKECDEFELKELNVKWNISWKDGLDNISYIKSNWYNPTSKVVLFKRKKINQK